MRGRVNESGLRFRGPYSDTNPKSPLLAARFGPFNTRVTLQINWQKKPGRKTSLFQLNGP
jgi:hypothetical protein